MMADIDPETWNRIMEREKSVNEVAAELLSENPNLGISAYVIAGDILSAERATELLEQKKLTPKQALNLVGSYARFDWAVKHLQKRTLFKMLPELWRGADPDDAKPEYLTLWREAWKRNGRRMITDNGK